MTVAVRNQLEGIVEDVLLGSILAHVTVRIGEQLVESAIARHRADEMKLKKGDRVTAVIRSTEVILLRD